MERVDGGEGGKCRVRRDSPLPPPPSRVPTPPSTPYYLPGVDALPP